MATAFSREIVTDGPRAPEEAPDPAAALPECQAAAPRGGAQWAEAPRWFAVLTLPGQEPRALRELTNQVFRAFLPRRQKSIRHARKTRTVLAPLFPRYLFVRLNLSRDRWRSINGTYGVSSIVRFGELPAPVPRGVIEALIEVSDHAGLVRLEDFLRPGQGVRLSAGPFAEQLGRLHRLDGPDAVRVLIEIMGRSVEVKVQRRNVLPA